MAKIYANVDITNIYQKPWSHAPSGISGDGDSEPNCAAF